MNKPEGHQFICAVSNVRRDSIEKTGIPDLPFMGNLLAQDFGNYSPAPRLHVVGIPGRSLLVSKNYF